MSDSSKVTKKPFSKSLIIGVIVTIIALVALTLLLWEPLSAIASDPDKLRDTVERAGIWGPVVFIGVQFLQVLVAPIPGQVAGALAGALFGVFWGTVYSMVGALLGFTLIFYISRRLGRPFVERFVSPEHLKKFDYLTTSSGPFVFFLIFLLPAFPDDLICYIAGLSSIRIRTLVLVSLAGRLPGYLVLSLVGAGVAGAQVQLVAIVLSVLLVIGALGIWQRKRLEDWVRRLSSSKNT